MKPVPLELQEVIPWFAAGSGVVAGPHCPHVRRWVDVLPQAPQCSLWPLQLAERLPGAPGSLLDLGLCRLLMSALFFVELSLLFPRRGRLGA